MNVLDLFSGIGGFSLGLERAGFRTVAFCEIDPYCRAVLTKHWPDVPCYDDIRTLDVRAGFADIVCGGFPCQPFSSASRGRGRSTQSNDYLWPEMLRVVSQCRPAWVIGENVVDLDRLALHKVVADLEGIGYQVAPPFEIPACAVGHDHRRLRLWILGYAHREGKPISAINGEMAGLSRAGSDPRNHRAPYGVPARVDRLRVLGNAIVPQIAEIIGRAIMGASVGLEASAATKQCDPTQRKITCSPRIT
jgi:DNA (cytosine-5)-methyltransferase 1